jgi:beta-glucosidase
VAPGRHGLSYTTFVFSDLAITPPDTHDASLRLAVTVTVTNTGAVSGSEVVQVYITLPEVGLTTPTLQLRGFAKARDVRPGTSTVVSVSLDKHAVSYWDARRGVWAASRGMYSVMVGKSCEDIMLSGEFKLEKDFTWTGL